MSSVPAPEATVTSEKPVAYFDPLPVEASAWASRTASMLPAPLMAPFSASATLRSRMRTLSLASSWAGVAAVTRSVSQR